MLYLQYESLLVCKNISYPAEANVKVSMTTQYFCVYHYM